MGTELGIAFLTSGTEDLVRFQCLSSLYWQKGSFIFKFSKDIWGENENTG